MKLRNRKVFYMKDIYVVGAAIIKDNQILCTKRATDRILGDLWEFPGGKIEPDEAPEAALVRELKEELGADILVGPAVATDVHQYDFGNVHLTVYYAQFTKESFGLVAHSQMKWCRQSELDQLTWAPADVAAMQAIQKQDLSQLTFK